MEVLGNILTAFNAIKDIVKINEEIKEAVNEMLSKKTILESHLHNVQNNQELQTEIIKEICEKIYDCLSEAINVVEEMKKPKKFSFTALIFGDKQDDKENLTKIKNRLDSLSIELVLALNLPKSNKKPEEEPKTIKESQTGEQSNKKRAMETPQTQKQKSPQVDPKKRKLEPGNGKYFEITLIAKPEVLEKASEKLKKKRVEWVGQHAQRIGRKDFADLEGVNLENISRNHFYIKCVDNKESFYEIVNESANGTFVNDRFLKKGERMFLKDGDKIGILRDVDSHILLGFLFLCYI